MNDHSDYVYRWVFGDKSTFPLGAHIAARVCGTPPAYHMVRRSPGGNEASLVHYDVSGQAVFQHLTRNKPNITGFPSSHAVLPREQCERYLADLRAKWSGKLWHNDRTSAREMRAVKRLIGSVWKYTRVGLDSRPIRFSPDRCISLGRARCEVSWNLFEAKDGVLTLVVADIDGAPTMILRRNGRKWTGRWLVHERCEVELAPVQP